MTRRSLGLAGLLAALLLVVIARASVCEDAYITFRVVDNAVHGFGLRWNIGERVQAYTNPLWMLLHIPLYAIWDNIFYVTLALSTLCTAGAVLIVLRTFNKPLPQSALFIAALCASPGFIDHSTSGLENPLTHLLFAAFGWALLRAPEKRFWLLTSFFCALSLVNRLDTAFFYGPIMLYLAMTRRVRIGQCILGALPIIAWEIFSLLYYGFPFPNTKYAKLGAGIAESEYVKQGAHYLLNFLALDFTSAAFVAAALILAIRKKSPALPVAFGIAAYLLYVMSVGGTHVSGRFLSLVIFASIWAVYGAVTLRPAIGAALVTALIIVRLAYPSGETLRRDCPSCFTGDIRDTGYRLLLWHHDPLPEVHRDTPPHVVVISAIGINGFTAGPSIEIIDPPALADALLARLPAMSPAISRIGHLPRALPKGYIEARDTGSLAAMDPKLAEYYTHLRTLISGDIWDKERLMEIWRFNSGAYDGLLSPPPARQYPGGRNLPASR